MIVVCYLCGKVMNTDKDDIRTDDETGEDICPECDEGYYAEDLYSDEDYDENSDYLFP